MNSLVTRRCAIVGTTCLLGATSFTSPANAFGPWWVAFSAGVAAGWLVEALKNLGFVPQAFANTSVQAKHAEAIEPVRQRGYSVRPLYSGRYSGGDFELSQATRNDNFMAFATTSHGHNVCTNRFDTADVINLALVSQALRSRGLSRREVEASMLPIHPPASNRYIDNRRYSPTFMTPSHGTIAWSMNADDSRPRLVTSIRSDAVKADLRFAQMNNGGWTYDINGG